VGSLVDGVGLQWLCDGESSSSRFTIPSSDGQNMTPVIIHEVGHFPKACDTGLMPPSGILAMATEAYATLLAIPGKQMGHVQLVHLPPCVPPAPLGPPPSVPPSKPPPLPLKHPVSMIAAHESALTTLSLPPSGRFLATTSSRGTLVRIWDTTSGKLLREFRRGADTAEIYGVAFRPDEKEVGVWSDKGTVHIFSLVSSGAS